LSVTGSAAERDDGRVVAQRLLVACCEAPGLLEQAERALDLRARLVPFLVVRQLLRAAAVGWDDRHAVLLGERSSEAIRVIRLVGEQAGRQHPRDQLFGRSVVVPLAFGDLERERQSERIDHDVDLGR